MLFYRVLLFSYLIDALLTLIPKLILTVAYLFFSSVILIAFLTASISTTKYAILNPGESLHYLLGYLKWIWLNKRHISLEHFFYTLVSFTTPYLSWKCVKKIAKTTIRKLRKSGKQYLKTLKPQILKKLLYKCAQYRIKQDTPTGKKSVNNENERSRTLNETRSYLSDAPSTHSSHKNRHADQHLQGMSNNTTPRNTNPPNTSEEKQGHESDTER
ncbi:hypothetical protein [Neorickettsia sp. 179522]|uniref:hypothetical protein n=1 Tax=Neorickettsia sp. 179522 TaxID=1714371 RepID=UPI00079B34ED|nr:hypothetical protein [Neorickettsia sp. 179522]KYH12603.1 hypothetical protein AS219_02270 [Neorickettsia sp. 179522]